MANQTTGVEVNLKAKGLAKLRAECLRSAWVWGLGPGEAEWYLTGVLLHDGGKVPVKSASDEEFEAGIRAEREAARKAAAEIPTGQESPTG